MQVLTPPPVRQEAKLSICLCVCGVVRVPAKGEAIHQGLGRGPGRASQQARWISTNELVMCTAFWGGVLGRKSISIRVERKERKAVLLVSM